MKTSSWLKNIRFYVLTISITAALIIYLFSLFNISQPGNRLVFLIKSYALLAASCLYLAVMATPITKLFPRLPFNTSYLKMRKALGVSTVIFALLHGYFAFFGDIGGLEGFGLLAGKRLFAVILGIITLTIFVLLLPTALDPIIAKLTYPKWKLLHRVIYLTVFFVTIHALILGSHFSNGLNPVSVIFSLALILLVILEGVRFFRYLRNKL